MQDTLAISERRQQSDLTGGLLVCQFENSLDKNFIIDRHPASDNVWLVGGGSGHGFKHGPAIGTRATRMIMGETSVDEVFSLARFRSD
jgi:sarcosine oxidase